jgi:hypothetical protein
MCSIVQACSYWRNMRSLCVSLTLFCLRLSGIECLWVWILLIDWLIDWCKNDQWDWQSCFYIASIYWKKSDIFSPSSDHCTSVLGCYVSRSKTWSCYCQYSNIDSECYFSKVSCTRNISIIFLINKFFSAVADLHSLPSGGRSPERAKPCLPRALLHFHSVAGN